jgi:hypothetical protein
MDHHDISSTVRWAPLAEGQIKEMRKIVGVKHPGAGEAMSLNEKK